MKRRCCKCGKGLGEKEPLSDTQTSDTYCPECHYKLLTESGYTPNYIIIHDDPVRILDITGFTVQQVADTIKANDLDHKMYSFKRVLPDGLGDVCHFSTLRASA